MKSYHRQHFLILCFFILVLLSSCTLVPLQKNKSNQTANTPTPVEQTDSSNKALQPIDDVLSNEESMNEQAESNQNSDDATSVNNINNDAAEENGLDINDLKAIENKVASDLPNPEEENANLSETNTHFLEKQNIHVVDSWIEVFAEREKNRFQRFLNNAYRYESFVKNIFREHNLPEKLFYVGIIESGYYLQAKSRANCVGPWQFAAAVGREFGLKVNRYQDERRDIEKATHAAARYFKDLYNIFGSWELALSAYNAGPYRIIGLIRREKTRDFYKLRESKRFPRETAEYVAKTKAAMEIAQNPTKYGFLVTREENPFASSKKIELRSSHNLSTIAKRLNVSVKTLKDLNPELRREITPTYRRGHYELRIPASTYESRTAEIKNLKNLKGSKVYVSNSQNTRSLTTKKSSYAYHRVKRGENLTLIAKKYKVSISSIKKFNHLRSNRIIPGQKLKLPRKIQKIYIVRRGDNLYNIARKFGKTTHQIIGLNSLKSHKIYPGQKLIVALNN
ncbi:MAG: LysM peptidoglycan-binding domain-containing protein [Halobacteriovoraceae bacterium]|nr:LysM peptidoglycan-binding domain-containing protein [Halobacteriovoraceae bacterium]MCB9093554.1 LysM peptidoglycan-binding domain-containing protein [Halobacteriovoraceae bacterium]